MPVISKIRFTNVIYENGAKRYNDMIFHFDGHNGAFLLENGGGKTVFIQTALQAVVPHIDMAGRKIKDTLTLESSPAHIAIEWILNDSPRTYGVTAVSLYMENNELKSLKYVYEYPGDDPDSIEEIPFVIEMGNGKKRPASRGEIGEYYDRMKNKSLNAHIFRNINDYGEYIEENFKIIPSEWKKIATINSGEGNVDEFFNRCKTTQQLLNNLLIPTVQEAIQGESAKDFVDTFEKQREHFKTNKRLLEEIEQFRLVKYRVDDYVEKYYGLHIALKEYEEMKREMKALFQHVRSLIVEKEQEQALLLQKKEQFLGEMNALDHKKISLKIRFKDQEIETTQQLIREMNREYDLVKAQFDEIASRKQNIEISKLMQYIKTGKMQIQVYEKELEEIDRNVSVKELQEQLNCNSENFRGYYSEIIEKIEREISTITSQYEREKDLENQQNTQYIQMEQQEKDMISKMGDLNGTLRTFKENMERIEKEVLDNYQEESIHQMKRIWDQRVKELAELKSKNLKRQEDIRESLLSINESLDSNQEEKDRYINEQIEKKLTLETIEKAQKELILDIESKSHNLYISDTIYTKEESIVARLYEKKIQLQDKIEKAMTDERINKRLIDMYKESDIFIPDPLIEKAIHHIKSEVGFISHGVEYLSTAKEISKLNENELFNLYPLWAISIVTTKSDLPKVQKYMEKYQAEMSYPIIIMTNEEINLLLKGQVSETAFGSSSTLYPFSWKDNLVQKDYHAWKESLLEQAKYYEDIRINAQKEYEKMTMLHKQAVDFFNKYPYDLYNQLSERVNVLEETLNKLSEQKNALSLQKEESQKEFDQLTKTLATYTEESNVLETKIYRCNEYLVIEKKYNLIKDQIADYKGKQEKLQKDMQVVFKSMTLHKDICMDLKNEKLKYENKKTSIMSERLYIQTKEFSPRYDITDKVVLENERESIEYKIRGINTNRNSIIDKIENEKEQLNFHKGNLELKEKEAKYPIEEIEVYLDKEENELIDKQKHLEEELKQLKHQKDQVDKKLTALETLRGKLDEEREERYDSIYIFKEELSLVKRHLIDEEKLLKQKKKDLEQQEYSVEKELKELQSIFTDIKVENGKHDFLANTIASLDYDENRFINFTYAKETTLKKYMERLEGAGGRYKDKNLEINREKQSYIAFCEKNIVDVKLRQTATNGVRKNLSYESLLDYQGQMGNIIDRSIKMAEEDRRQSDLELQTFLTHLNTYIKNVTIELNAIQKKTKIKVDNISKQIFIFDIPEWNEYEAKEELRKYIESIVEYYDEEIEKKTMDESGMRSSIEQKLSVKNLLNVVLKDNSIKIKCRKVTNDMKINKAPMMWESSNKWSGGEKWSKNMTLFLGLLNYLAEKKQYLSLNQKRHRTVILDNPFGKASSKHVLDPVFFIADKLGFQIIALTAHAEGQFIRDYFPVVYSGRLRHTLDGEKQIMTNERIINYAYLREKSPRSIARMEEKEQLTFFE